MPLPFIFPHAALTIWQPTRDGADVAFGFGRTWRFAASAGIGGPQIEGTAAKTWWQATRNVEYIEPLKALAPCGDTRPVAMASGDWTVGGNEHVRFDVYSANPPAPGVEYYDSSVYTSGVGSYATLTSVASLQPNIALHLGKQAVPGNQGCHTYVSIALTCQTQNAVGAWVNGVIGLVLPIQDPLYKKAFLHVFPAASISDTLNTETAGVTVSQGSEATGIKPDESFDTITLEYVPHPDGVTGGWVLIRDSSSTTWWMYHDPRVRLTSGPVKLTVSGMQCWVNLTPITYGGPTGAAAYGYANSGWPVLVPACNGSAWNTDPASALWGAIASDPSGWALDCGGYIVGTGTPPTDPAARAAWDYLNGMYAAGKWYYGHVGFTRSSDAARHTRPVAFAINELHTAFLGDADTSSVSTEGNKNLMRVSGTLRSDWRGADGTAEFMPEAGLIYPSARENAPVDISAGWQGNSAGGDSTLPIRKVAQGYVKPRGLDRRREGDVAVGDPRLTLQWGDFSLARAKGQVADAPQAGGALAGVWFEWCANLMGVPLSRVYIDSTVYNLVIPTATIPGDPKFEANGKEWTEHLTEVTKALNIRWGCDRNIGGTWYTLFLDRGKAPYIPGTSTISFIISDSNADENTVSCLTHENQPREYNGWRVETGPENQRDIAYAVESLEQRKAGIGQARWRTEKHNDSEEAVNTVDGYSKWWSGWTNTITWDTYLRPDMLPELFVEVQTDQFIGVAPYTVFQLDQHRYSADKDEQKSHFTGLIVYDPTGAYIPPYGGSEFGGG